MRQTDRCRSDNHGEAGIGELLAVDRGGDRIVAGNRRREADGVLAVAQVSHGTERTAARSFGHAECHVQPAVGFGLAGCVFHRERELCRTTSLEAAR